MVVLVTLLLAACGKDTVPAPSAYVPSISDPNSFLMFPNPQASLGAGDYSVLLYNYTLPSNPTNYTLTITHDDGSTQQIVGNWISTNEFDYVTLSMDKPGGVRLALDSGGANAFIGIVGGLNYLAYKIASNNPVLVLPKSQLNDASYAQAYYAAIDPTSAEDTLSKWKAANNYGSTANGAIEVQAIFHDTRDLGYGRRMTMRHDPGPDNTMNTPDDVVSAFVENYQVPTAPGAGYGAANLGAAIARNPDFHVGTNAIEVSPTPLSGGVPVTKFFTFSPTTGARLEYIDLDGRGAKSMPTPCISCHGGRGDPLRWQYVSASYQKVFPWGGDTWAHMQPFKVDTFEYSTTAGFTKADLEPVLKEMNKMVLCTWPLAYGTIPPTGNAEDDCRSIAEYGRWDSTNAATMVKSWYGGDGMPNATYSDTYVPTAWTDAGSGVSGSQNLYQTVVAPYCRTCHILRGSDQYHNDYQDFNSYVKFESYAPYIKRLVIDRGQMPLALLPYNHFWGDATAVDTLGTWLEAMAADPVKWTPRKISTTIRDGSSNVLRPGRPIADPGPDRTIPNSGSVKLSAANSQFADTYQWTKISCANATLANATAIRPTLTPTGTGVCQLQLVVGNGTDTSEPMPLNVTIAGSVTPAPSSVDFSYIRDILQGTNPEPTKAFCNGCHFDGATDMPVIWDDYDRTGNGCTTTCNSDYYTVWAFYEDIRARINWTDLSDSRMLRRPSYTDYHGGGLIDGFDIYGQSFALYGVTYDATLYPIFRDWVLNGAP
jgi:hypothetical protein